MEPRPLERLTGREWLDECRRIREEEREFGRLHASARPRRRSFLDDPRY